MVITQLGDFNCRIFYAGSPTSQVIAPETRQSHGVTYDLAREFAARLNVPVEHISFPRVADVVDAIKDGKVDFTVTNATPVRAQIVNFSRMLQQIETAAGLKGAVNAAKQ